MIGVGLIAEPDRAGDLVVQFDGHRIQVRGHHVVMGPAGEALSASVFFSHVNDAGFWLVLILGIFI